MKDSNFHGKLSSSLPSSSAYHEVVEEIETAFSIDLSFPARRNLVEELYEIVVKLEASIKKDKWLNALKEIRLHVESGLPEWEFSQRRAGTRNLLSGKLQQYKIAAFLFHDPASPEVAEVFFGLKCLLVSIVIQNPNNHRLALTAELFRGSDDPSVFMVLRKLPSISSKSFSEYYVELNDALEALQKNELKENERLILTRIANLVSKYREYYRPTIDFPLPGDENPTPALEGDTPELVDGLPIINKIRRFRKRFMKGKERPRGSAPVPVDFIDIEGSDDETELDVEIHLNETKYWLRRLSNVVPTDTRRFLPLERKHLINWLEFKLASPKRNDKLSAGLVGLIYFTGQPLKELMKYGVGESQTLSQGGLYIRKILRPDDSWIADDEHREFFEEIAEEQELHLPKLIEPWVSSLCTNQGSTLADSLKVNLEQAGELVKKALMDIRGNGLYDRITYDRLHLALKIETTLQYQDSVITYLLASTPSEGAPVPSYYVAYNTDKLASCYQSVTASMVTR